ncbi:MAG: sensor histidine kinase [Desulfomicrobium sp.]
MRGFKRMTPFIFPDCSYYQHSIRLEVFVPQTTELAARNEEIDRTRNEFLANMSHQFRLPLHGAVGMIELLKGSGLRSDQEVYVANALECLSHVNRLLTNIFNYSAVEAEKSVFHDEIVDVFSLQEELREVFASNGAGKDLKLDFMFELTLSDRIQGDVSGLRQILVNLVGNAAKITEKGCVCITARPIARGGNRLYIAFTVEDSGTGISTEHSKTTIEHFVARDNPSACGNRGAEVGLANIRRLVEQRGGDMSVQSVPDQGCIVSFFLPFKLVDRSGKAHGVRQEPVLASIRRPG